MPKKITHYEFVENLNKIKPHLEVLSEYNGNKNYITVRCKIHDHTWQSKPNWLMHEGKFDCQKCYDDRRSETRKNSIDFFINKGNQIHNNKFDYSKSIYVNNKTSVIIICPIHGEFKMTPEKHLTRKQGCPKCANKHVTTEDFIEKAKKIHGDIYDYSNTNYVNTVTKLSIICKKHGEFWQTPEVHLYSKCGCPICRESKLEKLLSDMLYNHKIKFISQYKIGWLGKQSLDFYLPDYKIAIECQGEQHFKPVKYFGGDQRFELDIKRDILKNQLCEDNEIKLIYITDLINLKKTILNKSIFLNIYNENNLICSSFKNIEKHLLKKNNIMNAIVEFQKKHGLVEDGIIGKNTLNKIKEILSINSNESLAHFMGQCDHESGGFKSLTENLNYSSDGLLKIFSKYFDKKTALAYQRNPEKIANRAYANRMGNGDEKSGDGWKHRGFGLIQLTGKSLQDDFSKYINDKNIIDHPELIATNYAFESAKFYFDKANIWRYTTEINNDSILNVSRIINLGNVNSKNIPLGLEDRVKKTLFYYNLLK